MTPRIHRLLLALLLLLPALSAAVRAQFVLTCPDNRIVISCTDCIFRAGFQP